MTLSHIFRPGLAAILVLAASGARAQQSSQDLTPAVTPPGHWFVPAANGGRTTTDTAIGDKTESVTVVAKRPSRTWRSRVTEQLNVPAGVEAGRPIHTFEKQKPYCNSALRTVGGQPANAADMVAGTGAGGC